MKIMNISGCCVPEFALELSLNTGSWNRGYCEYRSGIKIAVGHYSAAGRDSSRPGLGLSAPFAPAFSTPQLIAAMLKGREHVSDLVFSPGHAPQIELSGELVELKFRGLER